MILILSFLATILPQCAVEDDPWCVSGDVVNLAPADPAPVSLPWH